MKHVNRIIGPDYYQKILSEFRPSLFVTIGCYHEHGINTREITSKLPTTDEFLRFADFSFRTASKKLLGANSNPGSWFSGIYVFENKDEHGNPTLGHVHALLDIPDHTIGAYCRHLRKACQQHASKPTVFGFPLHLYPVVVSGAETYYLRKYITKNVVSADDLVQTRLMGELIKK